MDAYFDKVEHFEPRVAIIKALVFFFEQEINIGIDKLKMVRILRN